MIVQGQAAMKPVKHVSTSVLKDPDWVGTVIITLKLNFQNWKYQVAAPLSRKYIEKLAQVGSFRPTQEVFKSIDGQI